MKRRVKKRRVRREQGKLHATMRGFQRYGIMLELGDFADFARQISDGDAQLVRKLPRGQALYIVKYISSASPMLLPVLYNEKMQSVETILPRDDRRIRVPLKRAQRRLADERAEQLQGGPHGRNDG